jgi:hypothetical protein
MSIGIRLQTLLHKEAKRPEMSRTGDLVGDLLRSSYHTRHSDSDKHRSGLTSGRKVSWSCYFNQERGFVEPIYTLIARVFLGRNQRAAAFMINNGNI